MFLKATGYSLLIILSGLCLNQGQVQIAKKLVSLPCTQKSRIQNCTNQGPRPKASKREAQVSSALSVDFQLLSLLECGLWS